MNFYQEEKRRVNSRIKVIGCLIVFGSVMIYCNPEFNFTIAWATVGFLSSEFIRDFKHYLALRKLLSRGGDL